MISGISFGASEEITSLKKELYDRFVLPEIESVSQQYRTDLFQGEQWVGGTRDAEISVVQDTIGDLATLMLDTYIVPKDQSPVNNTVLKDEVFSEDNQREYYILRDAHPKGHVCLNGSFESKAQTSLFKDSFLSSSESYPVVVRVSSSSPDPVNDRSPDVRGMAIKVLNDDKHHDFVMLSSDIFPTDDVKQFGSLVKVARMKGCVGALSAGNDYGDGSWYQKKFNQVYQLLSNVPGGISCVADAGLELSEAPSVVQGLVKFLWLQFTAKDAPYLSKSFHGVAPYLYRNGSQQTVYKFEVKPVHCDSGSLLNGDEFSYSQVEKSNADTMIRNNTLRIIRENERSCFKVFAYSMPSYSDSLANGRTVLETHATTWDQLAAQRNREENKRVEIGFLTLENPDEMNDLACDQMTFAPKNMSSGHRAIGNLSRAREAVYRSLSNFRLRANHFLGSIK